MCAVCRVHSIPMAMVYLMISDTDNHEAFETNFEEDPCGLKQQFWECFHEWFFDMFPQFGNANGASMNNGN